MSRPPSNRDRRSGRHATKGPGRRRPGRAAAPPQRGGKRQKPSDDAGSKQRRALSPARTPGSIVTHGPRDLTHALTRALTQPQRRDEATYTLTHGVHTYAARMHPDTARHLVQLVLGGTIQRGDSGLFLDPFCGSGTTLVEARNAGLRVVGVDANPLAVAIAGAKTWTQPGHRLRELGNAAQSIAASALAEGKAARRSSYEAPPQRTPHGVDPEERNRRLLHWFAPHVRAELEHIAGRIDDIRPRDSELADILTMLLSSILYKVSRRASDTDATRVQRNIGRGAAARLFRQRSDLLLTGLRELAQVHGPAGEVYLGDARKLDEIGHRGQASSPDHSSNDHSPADATPDPTTDSAGQSVLGVGQVAGIVSSPPYAGTYEYAEHQRLRLDFLGLSGDDFRAAEIGARGHFQGSDGERKRRARRRYTRALAAAITEMARVCRPRAMVALMLGDSVAGERAMWAEEALHKALPESMELLAWAGQARPKLGRRELDAFGQRPKREYIFLLHRTS